ncbi:MAG: hypothetical protein ACNS64_04430 [Candidatus Halalkalibacterium sp. M3_1C_030]
MSEEFSEPGASEEGDKSWERENPDIVQEISIEEFQPKGTLALTLLYFAIVLLMWIFMYFVEFAGNAPSILE